MTLLNALRDELSAAGDRIARHQPHRKRRRHLFGLAVGGTLLLSGAAAAATDWRPIRIGADAQVVVPPPGPGNHGADHQTSNSALRAHLAPSGPKYLRDVDWDAARSFPVPGTELRGWTFDRPGRRCLALPDSLAEGYAVICKTPAEVASGQATIVFLPPLGSGEPNIVGAIAPPNERASIETPPGTAAHWARIGDDVYAGTAPAGSRLVVGKRRQAINPEPGVVVKPAPAPGEQGAGAVPRKGHSARGAQSRAHRLPAPADQPPTR